MAISTFPGFVGLAKETTPGTAVAATAFIPATTIASEDVRNYVADTGMRGSAVEMYNEIPTQGWGTFQFGGNVYLDTIGYPLKGLLGAETLTGSGPYVHALSTLNSSTYQGPTYTLVDYNGYEARSFPYGDFSQCEFTYGADQLLTYTAQATTFASSAVAKPTQTFTAKPAFAAYTTVVTFAGTQTLLVESATVTIANTVNPIIAINSSTSPTSIWSGAVSVSGSMTVIFNDDTFLTPMLSGTSNTLDFTTTVGADILKLHMSSVLFTAAPITRGSNGWMEITVAFTAVANTTDADATSGGYSPIKVTLTNSANTTVY